MTMPELFKSKKAYVGIDPGASGGVAVLTDTGIKTYKLDGTESDIVAIFEEIKSECEEVFAVLEKVQPMPSTAKDKSKETQEVIRQLQMMGSSPVIQKAVALIRERQVVVRGITSTWTFAQNYGMLRGVLVALGIPFHEVRPQGWLKLFQMGKTKGERQGPWKNRLKGRAQQLHPNVKITLQTADAILIAEFAKAYDTGTFQLR